LRLTTDRHAGAGGARSRVMSDKNFGEHFSRHRDPAIWKVT